MSHVSIWEDRKKGPRDLAQTFSGPPSRHQFSGVLSFLPKIRFYFLLIADLFFSRRTSEVGAKESSFLSVPIQSGLGAALTRSKLAGLRLEQIFLLVVAVFLSKEGSDFAGFKGGK